MWFIEDETDEPILLPFKPCRSASDGNMTADECDSMENNAVEILSVNDSMIVPLPCPCSETTLSSTSYASLQCVSRSRQFLRYFSSTMLEDSCLEERERPRKARRRAKRIRNSILVIAAATFLVFLRDTADICMKCMRNLAAKKGTLISSIHYGRHSIDNGWYGPHVYHVDGTIRVVSAVKLHRYWKEQNHRQLAANDDDLVSGSRDSKSKDNSKPLPQEPLKDPQLVIAGRMTVKDEPCNIAQLNLKTGKWSLHQRIQLSLYTSYSGGDVYSLLANHSLVTNSNAREFSSRGDSNTNAEQPHVMDENFGSELVVVGAFDTTYRNSQTTYCSVGKWDGSDLSKIGEGLCNSALSKGMKITCSAIAGPNDLFVGGSFQTQVWNGNKHEFVKIFNIAHYNARDQVWLPITVGQITCSWCTVTILALAWDSERMQLHVAGKFNSIDGYNIPAALALYDQESGHLTAHPGGGLTMLNITEDGVGTALQFDQENGVLYVMGAFERLTKTNEECLGLAAYEIRSGSWTCLVDPAHSVQPTGGGNMLLTPYGLLVAGKTREGTTWPDNSRPYTVAVLKATIKKKVFSEDNSSISESYDDDDDNNDDDNISDISRELQSHNDHKSHQSNRSANTTKYVAEADHEFVWSWLPGFQGHNETINTLSNGFGDFVGTVFIGGDNFLSKWSYISVVVDCNTNETKIFPVKGHLPVSLSCTHTTMFVPVTVDLANDDVQGMVMAISQLDPPIQMRKGMTETITTNVIGYTIIAYLLTLGTLIGLFLALLCNKKINQTIMSFLFDRDEQKKGISLDTLTYSHDKNTNVAEAYHRAMSNRFVDHPHLLTLIDPQEVILHRIIGEGTFGRVWSAKWGSSGVAVKEFVFAQAAIAGKSMQQQAIVEEIIGEAGMMAILRHPNVLQLFGCSLTSQAIWIVSELCSLGSLRQLLDDRGRTLLLEERLNLALQVAEGMTYLHSQDPPIIHRDLKSHNIFVHETFNEIEAKEIDTKDKSFDRKLIRWPLRSKSDDSNKIKRVSSDTDCSNNKVKPIMNAKIGDWGSARATLAGSKTMTHGVGTACWMAPEVLKHARCSKHSDVYGFGIILWELATRREVYEELESTQIIAMVANDHLRPEIPVGCPWNALMVKCWMEEPLKRPTFDEIVKELNRLRPTVKKSTFTGEELQVPKKWKSYQKEAVERRDSDPKNKTG